MQTLTAGAEMPDWSAPRCAGRACSRPARCGADAGGSCDFHEKGVGSRTIQRSRDAAEELLTNAFYDAPVAAGALPKPVPRTYDVALPDDCACDLAYGCSDDIAIVHVRDPFGSLTRKRLLDVLSRCAASDMSRPGRRDDGRRGARDVADLHAVDRSSRLGPSKQRHTEILVGVAKRGGERASRSGSTCSSMMRRGGAGGSSRRTRRPSRRGSTSR